MAVTFGNSIGFSGSSSAHNNDGNFLIVSVSSTSNNVTGITYNSVAMTQISSTLNNAVSGRYISLWGLVSPATGSNTISISGGTNQENRVASMIDVDTSNAYTGAGTAEGTSASPAITITTTVNNAYVVGIGFIRDFTSVGANTTVLENGTDANFALYRSTNAVSPAGNLTLNINSTGSEWDFIAIGVNPVAPAGPANLKSINGLAKASIKSRNSLAIGSIKSINGLS